MRKQRSLLLGLEAVDDRHVEHCRVFARQDVATRRGSAQQRPNPLELGDQRRAFVTPVEVRRHGDLVGKGQLSIVVRVQPPARCRASERLHAVLASRSSRRSACRARVNRDFTVPTATPSE